MARKKHPFHQKGDHLRLFHLDSRCPCPFCPCKGQRIRPTEVQAGLAKSALAQGWNHARIAAVVGIKIESVKDIGAGKTFRNIMPIPLLDYKGASGF